MRLFLPRAAMNNTLAAAGTAGETGVTGAGAQRPDGNRFGAIESALLKLTSRSATVIDVHKPANRYRLITLEGEALKNVRWQPGQKIQVRMGGFASRTYTPILWDGAEGVVQLLAYLHHQMIAATPATLWAESVRVGDTCHLSGPRNSLNLSALSRPALFFGDETSIGLARALKATPGGFDGVSFVLEVSSLDETRKLLDVLNLPDMDLVKRARDDFHLSQVETVMAEAIETGTPWQFMLSGKARSIQRLTRFLRAKGVPASRFNVKPYWATGRSGLD